MVEKLTNDQLIKQLDEHGWRTVSGKEEAMPSEGTLRQMAEIAHQAHISGRAAAILHRIGTEIEVDALQLQELWYHLGLPIV